MPPPAVRIPPRGQRKSIAAQAPWAPGRGDAVEGTGPSETLWGLESRPTRPYVSSRAKQCLVGNFSQMVFFFLPHLKMRFSSCCSFQNCFSIKV